MTPRFLPPALLAVLAASGCPGPSVTITNQAPLVSIVAPTAPDGADVVIDADTPVQFVCQVSDGQTLPEDLLITWTALDLNTAGGLPAELGQATADNDGLASFSHPGLPEGNYLVEVVVVDEGELSASAQISLFTEGEDLPPSIAITTPLPGQEFVDGDSITFSATAADDRGVDQIEVVWRSSQEGELFSDTPDGLGLVRFSREDLSVGEHLISATVTDASGQSDSDQVEILIDIQDLPPSPPAVDVVPNSPRVEDDLNCLITVPSVDPNGTPVTYTYEWFRDGGLAGFSASTVTATNTLPAEEWRCRVTPRDGTGLVGEWGEDLVTIGNTAPSFEEVTLVPDPAYEDSSLLCQAFGFSDPDGDPAGFLWSWTIDGAVVAGPESATLSGEYFDRGDEVWCTATPFDGFSAGESMDSNAVIISNSVPTQPEIAVEPTSPTRSDDLDCFVIVESTDADPTDLITYEYDWWVGGAPSGSVTPTLPASETVLGDTWTCRVRAFDGIEASGWAEVSVQIMPQPGDVVISEMMIVPDGPSSAYGQWIELHNPTPEAVSLEGWRLEDDGTDGHDILLSAPVIGAGQYVILGISDDPALNGGVPVDYRYNGMELDPSEDEVVLSFLGVVVDRVAYGPTYPVVEGQAMTLNPTFLTAADNDLSLSWCASTTPILPPPLASDFGTPGFPNDACACFESDDDHDGFGDDPSCAVIDCNDVNAAVNPNVFEICEDGLDQDCDGIDPNCDCADTDDDGDGFGTGAACTSVDCNDADVAVFPGAPEYCDGIDNDCNGDIDPTGSLGGTTYYVDADDDTWGTSTSLVLCAPSGDYTAIQSGDCYDSNANARPGTSSWYTTHRGDSSYDYDCDGDSERHWFDMSGDCAFFDEGLGCVAEVGWSGSSPPACGSASTWESGCYYSTSGWPWEWGCYWGSRAARTQECQ